MRARVRFIAVYAAIGASGACSLLVDTSDLAGGTGPEIRDATPGAEGAAPDAADASTEGAAVDSGDAGERGRILFFARYGSQSATNEYFGPFGAAEEGVRVTLTSDGTVDFGNGVGLTSSDGAKRVLFAVLDADGGARSGASYGPTPFSGGGSAFASGVVTNNNGALHYVATFTSSIVVADAAIAAEQTDSIVIHQGGAAVTLFNGSGDQSITSAADFVGVNLAVAGVNTGSMRALGRTYDASAPDASPSAMFVGRVTGANPWLAQYGETINPPRVAVDKTGNVFVAAGFRGTIDLGKGPLTCVGDTDVLVAKLDPLGATVWSKRFGNALLADVRAISADASGDILVGGWFTGSIDFGKGAHVSAGGYDWFVAKLDPAGNEIWSKTFGGPSNDFLRNLTTDAQGNVIVLGDCQGVMDLGALPTCNGAGGADAVVVKLDPAGARLWHHVFVAKQQAYLSSVAATPSGNIWVGGHYRGPGLELGAGAAFGASSSDDAYLVKLSP
jgi:hypothetical protein